jgi:hypothetical protein
MDEVVDAQGPDISAMHDFFRFIFVAEQRNLV